MTTESKAPAAEAPAAKPAPMHAAVDAFTGKAVDPFLGAAPHDDDDFAPTPEQRGDVIPEPLKAEPPKAEEPKVEEVVEAKAEEPKAEEPKAEEAKPHEELERDEKGRWIPKDRFDQVNERRKTAERKLQEFESQKSAQTKAAENAYDFDAAEERYMDAVLDGNKDLAKATRREIDAGRREGYLAEFRQVATDTYQGARVKETVDTVIDSAVARYEVLDDTHANFNAEIVGEVDAYYSGFMAKGMSAVEALKKAIDTAAKVHDLGDKTPAPTPVPVTPAVVPARKSIGQKLADVSGQPPSTNDVGASSASAGQGALNVNVLSDEEYDALPESTRAKLRGDFFSPG